MDYDAQLEQFCPPEYVRRARAEDLLSYPENHVIVDAWGRSWDGRASCVNALIAYFTPKMARKTHPQQVRLWLNYLAGYEGALPDDLAPDVRAALLRIDATPDLAEPYFLALMTHRLDVREELAERMVPDWMFGRLKQANAQTWYYYRYLAIMGEAVAYEALADKVAATTDGNVVFSMLESLAKLETIPARNILSAYREDPRNLLSASGRKTPLSAIVPMMIDLGNWK